jgi:hypothetical protein
MLISSSNEVIETILTHCDITARDLLLPYGAVVIVLSTILRIKCTLDGAKIDKIIWDVEADDAMAIERRRCAGWRRCGLAIERLRTECVHPNAAASSQSAPDRTRQSARSTIRSHGEHARLDDLEWSRGARSSGSLLWSDADDVSRAVVPS